MPITRPLDNFFANSLSSQYTSLVAWLPLVNAFQTDDLFDSHPGSASGSPSFPTNLGSPLESGMDCDGSDDHIDITSAAALDADPMIISFWAALDRTAMDNTIANLLDKASGSVSTNNGWYMFFVDRDSQSEVNGFNVTYDRSTSVSDWYDKTNGYWDTDAAIHTLVSFDTSASPVIQVYKNGSIFTPSEFNQNGSGSHVASSINVGIGGQANGSNLATGVLTDVRFYSLGRASAGALATAMTTAATYWELYGVPLDVYPLGMARRMKSNIQFG